ncbi:helix-turn-helix transcriptional regulator [uncultured Williamsia sp.]|uniref:helix-turn-helix domain-containing protein n=1 Tax=uncultured Williamsia sp. TaxID=259311 RepID=UPI002606C728|nr:helix-turn-helix transcriptional regulator [uncultured Williamsia sp.]
MVRVPLTPEQLDAGRRLGAVIREARGDLDPGAVAAAAGISPETLRKIEVGRIPSPGFGTVLAVCEAIGLPLDEAVEAWKGVRPGRLAG